MTIEQALRAISNYPIPRNVIEVAGIAGGVDLSEFLEQDTLQSSGYLQAQKHVIQFLLTAASSISEQGVSFSVGDDEKSELRKLLSSINQSLEAAELAEGETPKQRRPNVAFDAY